MPEGLTLVLQGTIDETLNVGTAHQVLSPNQAANIDRKIDDGKAGTGDIMAAGGGDCKTGGVNSDTYDEAATDKPRCTIGYIIDD